MSGSKSISMPADNSALYAQYGDPKKDGLPKCEKKDFELSMKKTVFKLLNERTKDLIKGVGQVARWTKELKPGLLDLPLVELSNTMTLFKNAYCGKEVLEKADDVFTSAQDLWYKGVNRERTVNLLVNGTHLVNSAIDGTFFVSAMKFISLSSERKNLLQEVNFGATALGSLPGLVVNGRKLIAIIIESVKDYRAEKVEEGRVEIAEGVEEEVAPTSRAAEFREVFIVTAINASYFALGAIGLYTSKKRIEPGLKIAIAATSGLFFTFVSFFNTTHYNLGDFLKRSFQVIDFRQQRLNTSSL